MFRKYDILKKRKGMTFLYNFDNVSDALDFFPSLPYT